MCIRDSPCTGQVTHALLTRPPLSHPKIIRRISQGASFDLHVLGTPPAFILSQDQTLKNKQDVSSSLKDHWSHYCFFFWVRTMFSSMDPSADITRFRTPLNWIERSRLFCYSVINLLCPISRALSLESAKAFIFYHSLFCLSRTFFIFFKDLYILNPAFTS